MLKKLRISWQQGRTKHARPGTTVHLCGEREGGREEEFEMKGGRRRKGWMDGWRSMMIASLYPEEEREGGGGIRRGWMEDGLTYAHAPLHAINSRLLLLLAPCLLYMCALRRLRFLLRRSPPSESVGLSLPPPAMLQEKEKRRKESLFSPFLAAWLGGGEREADTLAGRRSAEEKAETEGAHI